MRKHAIAFLALLLGAPAAVHARPPAHPPSVILIIGDGLGASFQEALRILDGPLAVDAFPHTALVRTGSADHIVTDSAAAASAMATGRKGANGSLSVDSSGKAIRTVAELAAAGGTAVGLVTTAFLWDATPAAFVAHNVSRDELEDISAQMLAAKPRLLYGGGEQTLLPHGTAGRFGPGSRRDGRNLLQEAKAAGYRLVARPAKGPLPQLGVFAAEDLFSLTPAQYRSEVTLPAMVAAAFSSLESSPHGFFLVIEEEGTDEMMHAAAISQAVEAARHWNQAVALAAAYRKRNPHTVIIVTSDHETGSFSIAPEEACKAALGRIDENAFAGKYARSLEGTRQIAEDRSGKRVCFRAWTNRHTAAPVPLYSAGVAPPGVIIDNTDIHRMLRNVLQRR